VHQRQLAPTDEGRHCLAGNGRIALTAVQTYIGGCHCGRVRFEVTTGALHHQIPLPPDRFRLLAGADDLATYLK